MGWHKLPTLVKLCSLFRDAEDPIQIGVVKLQNPDHNVTKDGVDMTFVLDWWFNKPYFGADFGADFELHGLWAPKFGHGFCP